MKFAFPVHRQPARVTYGAGSVRALASEPLDERTAIFVSADPGVRAAVDRSLARRGVHLDQARVLVKPSGEPTRAMIEDGAAWLAGARPRRIVGLGGGSVLDWCRLSWAVADGRLDPASGRVNEPDEAVTRPALWLIPTTCATGAEAAGVAVYADAGRKVPVVSASFVADDVILDGQFLAGISDARLGSFLGDAASHAVEAFVSVVPGTLAKEAAVSALGLLLRHVSTPPGPSRSERLMEAGYLAGLAASHCSVGVVHAFAHTVAAFGVPHGYANALALEAGMTANADVPALAQLAARLGHGSVRDLRQAVAALVSAAGSESAAPLRQALEGADTRASVLARMAIDPCLRTNPRPLVASELSAFLDVVRARLNQDASERRHATAIESSGVR